MIGAPGRRVIVSEFAENPMQAVDALRIETQPPPAVDELGPEDTVIAVKSAAVGWVDLLMSSGQYQHMANPPYCPGLEYSGEVVFAGEGTRNQWKVGDRVIADAFVTGPRSLGDYQQWGGFASYAVAPANALMPLPDSWSFDQGACLLGNYETAYHCLVARGKLRAGECALIHGASGSTGLAAVHIAKIVGATVIATGRNDEKLAEVQAQGADHILNTSEREGGVASLRDRVKALTGGLGVDVVYDGVGGAISTASIRCVKFGARYLIVGWAATPFVAKGRGGRGAPNANQLPTNLIMMKGLDVLGCPTAITTHREPAIRTQRLKQINEWIRADKLTPHVGHVYAFEEVQEAMRAKWESRHVGGCVLRPS